MVRYEDGNMLQVLMASSDSMDFQPGDLVRATISDKKVLITNA
jgi:hypothetical protein